jgi:hypothetical protein
MILPCTLFLTPGYFCHDLIIFTIALTWILQTKAHYSILPSPHPFQHVESQQHPNYPETNQAHESPFLLKGNDGPRRLSPYHGVDAYDFRLLAHRTPRAPRDDTQATPNQAPIAAQVCGEVFQQRGSSPGNPFATLRGIVRGRFTLQVLLFWQLHQQPAVID